MASRKHAKTLNVKPLVRLVNHLPSNDLTLIVLKGHLLIEEQLVSLIEGKMKHPAALGTRMSFSHRLRLAKAMFYQQENAWVWTSIDKLNEVRNHLAHNVEATNLDVKGNDFINSIGGVFTWIEKQPSKNA
jgi:hypothetical protein